MSWRLKIVSFWFIIGLGFDFFIIVVPVDKLIKHFVIKRGLTLCLLGNFACSFVVCWYFSKSTFSKNSFRNTMSVSNSLDPDQGNLGTNCLQRLWADNTRRQRVKESSMPFNTTKFWIVF